jgi:virginiamycin B lyase
MQEFDVPKGAYGITEGPDGALWITLVHDAAIARLKPSTGLTAPNLRTFALPNTDSDPSVITTGPELDAPHSEPHGITRGPNDTVWAALEIGSVVRLPGA